jgi:hypothetical protein
MALVEMSVVEQRYRAVLAVGRGEPKIVVAAQFGVSRQTLHTWLTLSGGRRGSHPPAPTDPGVTVSRYPALVILVIRQWGAC